MATVISRPQDTPLPVVSPPPEAAEPLPDKISAYYSLVFPNFTYYLQTLTVTIGRRCVPANIASTSDSPQVDVDLGSLKSVSRLHARIEYDENEERFVLVVLGRNGAWVDGVWSGSGSKVPLGDRSQIQIASRTFHFILPPPAPPEDSPSPSSQSSGGHRARSPSVDITSYSPPSSLPSQSPPPVHVPASAPKIPPLPDSALPNSNAIPHKPNGKKRKKPDTASPPLPTPEVMPPKPQLTYAQLCYRAIKALNGKASLQEICQWIKDTFDWYKYCSKDWESSVRHNLSSNPGFKKLLRPKDEKGKGALWGVDEAHEQSFEELDARKSAAVGVSGGKDGKLGGKKGRSVPLEPPLKRSVKGDLRGAPLPPPLTSAPLVFKTTKPAFTPDTTASLSAAQTPPTACSSSSVKAEELSASLAPSLYPPAKTCLLPAGAPPASVLAQQSQSSPPSSGSSATTPFPVIPASVRIPIVVGPVPASHNTGDGPPQPIVLHANTLILNPEIFAHLTQPQLQDLEKLGAQKALEILQAYIVRYYKEKLKAEGSRGRGRGRPRRGRGGATGRGAASTGTGASAAPHTETSTGPFTTAPLPSRSPSAHPPIQAAEAAPDSPIVVVDDDDDPEHRDEPAAKRRRLEDPVVDVMTA
ncbi:uncharacterized protein BXZ73DRAFT_87535 [Epithele typhae]|uniref:uncharacterized protein n=1 Tax=Epithele typhae TaxID=378194 RepID=UPI002007AA38|nr:uncharacterized protein BXZ73DRAFT_87535 [Epithele typhae]KAH9943136.1 hypothetical protein BXZ73DRAFT_87535 [Epithele typhae]